MIGSWSLRCSIASENGGRRANHVDLFEQVPTTNPDAGIFPMITQPYGSRADFLIRVDTIREARDIDWQRTTSGEARVAVVVVREHWASASASTA
jgi:hypothetical protein